MAVQPTPGYSHWLIETYSLRFGGEILTYTCFFFGMRWDKQTALSARHLALDHRIK